MATEKIINTRLQLKYDTLANWQAVENSFIPKAGELIIINVPAAAGVIASEPAILFKVGNGTDVLSALPFTSGLAGDVHAWAKAAAKPTYTAAEISGLADFISGEIEDTNTKYKLEQDEGDAHLLVLSAQEKGQSTWTTVATITTADTIYDDTAVKAKLDGIADGAQVNVIETVKVNGTAVTPGSNKDVDITVPTKVSDLTNDSKFQTEAEVAATVAAAGHLKRKKVASVDAIGLKAADADQYIYMVPKAGDQTGDKYDEYMVIDGAVERVGDWAVDLSDYVEKEDGKGLSTNDFTDALKVKLDGIADNAQVNVIEGVKVNGVAVTPDASKNVDLTVPTGALANKDKVAKTDLADALKTEIEGKANDADLAAVAKTGKVADVDFSDTVLVLNCGSATVNV